MKKISECFSKSLEKMPVSSLCPLIKNPKWNCGKLNKGNESCCKSISGYINCPHYIKWFHWNVMNMAAKEIARAEIKQKKKKQKEKVK